MVDFASVGLQRVEPEIHVSWGIPGDTAPRKTAKAASQLLWICMLRFYYEKLDVRGGSRDETMCSYF